MILLLGGTSETVHIARSLADAGLMVMLSMATEIALREEIPEGIIRRTGVMDQRVMSGLIRDRGVSALVDATHPYAERVSINARQACTETGIPYIAYERPGVIEDGPDIHWAEDHGQAAALACSFGKNILLTIGVRNLAPYVREARLKSVHLTARILDLPSSLNTCLDAGLRQDEIIQGRGPFSQEENRLLISSRDIGVMVTKDSGQEGGVIAKIRAARDEGCRIVVVRRPLPHECGYSSIPMLVKAVRLRVNCNR